MTLEHVIWFLLALAILAWLGTSIALVAGAPPRHGGRWMLAFLAIVVIGGLLRGLDLFIV